MEVSKPSLNELTIEQDVRTPKRCCYCIPHRLGLYVLALVKLVLNFVILTVIIFTLFLLMVFSQLELLYPIIVIGCVAIFIISVDLFIGIVAIVSICVKDPGMLKMYYRYTVYVFGSLTVLCCVMSFMAGTYIFFSTDILSRHKIAISILFGILLSILVLQVCLNLMVKKEVLILRNNEQFLL